VYIRGIGNARIRSAFGGYMRDLADDGALRTRLDI
jgi:hypothetical protein